MIVYELVHCFHRVNGHMVLNPLALGLYSSINSVQQAIQYYISKPGFHDNPEAFSVRQRNVQGLVEGLEIFETIVYFHTNDYEYEYTVELGLFGKEALAHDALSTFVQENIPLFNVQDLVVEKIINCCILDRREWSEGFSIAE